MPWTINDIPAQDGKIAIVTGGNSGIGYDACWPLAVAGAEVVLAARDRRRGEEAAARIRANHPKPNVRFEQLDLGSLASVRDFAGRIGDSCEKIDLLINNAGVMALPKRDTTEDGFERQFGVNFLGHFALTAHLIPLLRKAAAPRTVQLSSLAHRRGRINFEDLQAERRYSPWEVYSQTKLAMLMFALELGRRADAARWGLLSTAAHPGWANTRLMANGPGSVWSGRLLQMVSPLFMQSSAAGAWPTLYAATSGGASQGGYYGPQGKGEIKGPPGPAKVASQALNEAVAARLWGVAEELTGVRLDLVPAVEPAAIAP